jgi:hypothetical protein
LATNVGHYGAFAAHLPSPSSGGETMNSALAAAIIAIGGTSLVCILVSQIQNRWPRERRSGSAGTDGGYYAGGGDSGSQFSGSSDTGHGGSHHSTGSDNSGDSGGSDSGGR